MRRVLLAALMLCFAGAAEAQTWPAKPVHIIVPAPAGTAPDIITRLVANKLTPLWGSQVVVENRPGAGGIPGMTAVARAAPDGYTLGLVMATVLTLTPHLYKDPQFNVDTQFAPVAMVGTSPMLLVVNPGLGVNSVADLAALAKQRPDSLNFAPPLLNSVPHLAGEMLSTAAGIKLHLVPYSGSVAAATATMTGESQVMIDGIPALAPYVKDGKLKALAVTSKQRLPGYEDLPTLDESFPGLEAIGWFSVLAVAGTPADILNRVNRDVNTVIADPEMVARFADLGVYPSPNSMQDAAAFIAVERKRWAATIRDAGIQPQ
jgi:tripartite-type tricarboxylate transporter receptor subunit TctC